MVVQCGSLISRCRCFDCSNVAQVTLTWLVRGLFVSSVGFFCPAVLVGMKLGQTYSADLYYPVASNPKTSWEHLWRVRLTWGCCRAEKHSLREPLRISWLWEAAAVLCLSAGTLLRDSDVPTSVHSLEFSPTCTSLVVVWSGAVLNTSWLTQMFQQQSIQ